MFKCIERRRRLKYVRKWRRWRREYLAQKMELNRNYIAMVEQRLSFTGFMCNTDSIHAILKNLRDLMHSGEPLRTKRGKLVKVPR